MGRERSGPARGRWLTLCAAAVVAGAVLLGGGRDSAGRRAAADEGGVVLVGAGDISRCDNNNDEATAVLLDGIAGTVYTLGDTVYNSGTAAEFATCYAPTWGRHKARTSPASGNHEYVTAGATGYYDYFNGAGQFTGPAGDRDKGYYGYDVGAWWHVIVLNSECAQIGGCGVGSPQETWLRADLAAHADKHVVAMWHKPRFSSGSHGNDAGMQALWAALYDYGAELVLNGHDHVYERFAPQDAAGALDTTYGVREIIAGTGGASHVAFGTIRPNSEVRNATTYGVLMVTLKDDSYDWEFVPVAGQTFTDSGSGDVHGPPSAATPTATSSSTSTATATATATPTATPTPTMTPTATPSTVDTDGDGYTDAREGELGEDPQSYCATMRADVNGDGRVNSGDLLFVAVNFGTVPPGNARANQGPPPRDGAVNSLDILLVALRSGSRVGDCP